MTSCFRRFAVLGVAVGLCAAAPVHANETVVEKAQSALDDAGKDARKAARQASRDRRRRTGGDSVAADAKDAANDVRDEATTGAKKLRRKVD